MESEVLIMTQLTPEHFELHDHNKAERYDRQKIKFLEIELKHLKELLKVMPKSWQDFK